ncbi:MAG: endonuclease [Bacteroidaceae bacterium]|nr:endonuclease [Bacteroidaceae bacterium]
MKRLLLASTLAVTVSLTWAQIPSGYYDSAEGKTGKALRAALHEIIKGHTVISYDGLKAAYFYTDIDASGKLWDIYSDYRWTAGQVCGNYSVEGDCWNREHTWPQSWFGSGTPKSDLFHVLPTDGKVNGMRSNHPYGEVSKATYTSKNGSKLGTCKTSGYSGTVFEPIDEYKGDIARGFFYMSTRYYTEDSSWSSSDMTTKCEIKDWALKMLLRWHKEDPVSQKEIDRNNVIYASYQHNRNPFIDHPEYAQMIWDEDWTEGTSYNITSATNLNGGTVSAPYSALEGSTVSITATPNSGYEVSGYSAWKTGDTSTKVTVSNNGTFTMPAYPVTVSATFKKNTTQYAITLASIANGSISASATSALSGTTITLTATPATGYKLNSFYVYKTGDMSTTVEVSDGKFVMPSFNVTASATFVIEDSSSGGGTGDFVKVTTAPSDWSGEYLIVCEDYDVAFNGNVESNWGYCSSVTIDNNTIKANSTTTGYVVTITPNGSGYTIQFPDNNYMNWTGEKKFSEGTSPTTYSISLSGGNVIISYGNYSVMYNYNNGNANAGLRSYKSGQTHIQLYKREASATPEPVFHTVTFIGNDDSQVKTQNVEEYVRTALDANTFTLDGYTFYGWQDADGNYYADGAYVTLLSDLTLYALWDVIIGDINRDGVITIADVTALVNIILGKDDDEPHLYNHAAADVNEDGGITIADVTALVNIILGKH